MGSAPSGESVLTTNEIYKLFIKDLIETIATGETLRSETTGTPSRVVIKGFDNETVFS